MTAAGLEVVPQCRRGTGRARERLKCQAGLAAALRWQSPPLLFTGREHRANIWYRANICTVKRAPCFALGSVESPRGRPDPAPDRNVKTAFVLFFSVVVIFPHTVSWFDCKEKNLFWEQDERPVPWVGWPDGQAGTCRVARRKTAGERAKPPLLIPVMLHFRPASTSKTTWVQLFAVSVTQKGYSYEKYYHKKDNCP